MNGSACLCKALEGKARYLSTTFNDHTFSVELPTQAPCHFAARVKLNCSPIVRVGLRSLSLKVERLSPRYIICGHLSCSRECRGGDRASGGEGARDGVGDVEEEKQM